MSISIFNILKANSSFRTTNQQQTNTTFNENNETQTDNSFDSKVTNNAIKSYAVSNIEIQNLKKLQKIFQDVFLNPDIEIGEAKIMFERYKDILKIEDKEEFVKALFKEVKSNYGFRNSIIQLEFLPPEEMIGCIGAADNSFDAVKIRSDLSKEKIFETMHHEFRHHKQNYITFNYSPEKYMHALNKKIETMTDGKVINAWKDVNKLISWYEERLGEKCSKENVPPRYTLYARQCLHALENYIEADKDSKEYWNNFNERDARHSASLVVNLFK